MHLAEEGEFISKAAQAEIKATLASKPNATVYSYPGQRHAFARHNGTHYNAAAAALDNGRTSEFLQRDLGAPSARTAVLPIGKVQPSKAGERSWIKLVGQIAHAYRKYTNAGKG